MPTKYLGCREMSRTKNQLSKKLTAAESNANCNRGIFEMLAADEGRALAALMMWKATRELGLRNNVKHAALVKK